MEAREGERERESRKHNGCNSILKYSLTGIKYDKASNIQREEQEEIKKKNNFTDVLGKIISLYSIVNY